MVGSCRAATLSQSEADLEKKITRHIREAAPGPILANFSPTNMDRVISFLRACQQTRTELVIDLFTAYLYEQFRAAGWKIPALKDSALRVLYFRGHADALAKDGKRQFLFDAKESKIEFSKALLLNSQYEGVYPGQEQTARDFSGYIAEHRISKVQVHTSGHAFEPDLKRFVDSIKPKVVIPIHTCHPGQYNKLFTGHRVKLLSDGVPFEIPAV